MATRKKTKTEANRYLQYYLTNSETPGTMTSHYIDLARDLSRVNRRLYRQGRDYHVKKISIVSTTTPNSGNSVSACVIPDTWVARNAWHRGFRVMKDMYKNASENVSGNIEGTWSDFKVFMSNAHRSGTKPNPIDSQQQAYAAGEWDYSNFVSPDGNLAGDAFEIHWVGVHNGVAGAWNSISLVESYGESRATVQLADPSVPAVASDDPLINIFDDGETVDTVINIMEDFNDNPPYDHGEYPQGSGSNAPNPVIVAQSTIVDGRSTLPGFHALGGLVELQLESSLPNDIYSVLVELAPGSYRGVSAEVI